MMIGYVTLGTNDREKSSKFYDALCGELGVGRMMENEQFIAWGKPGGGAGIGLTKPFDGNAATVGNGVMVALEAKDEAQVQRLYDIAIANGGREALLTLRVFVSHANHMLAVRPAGKRVDSARLAPS
jgi:catechol 2,3-dioxygenase-like lactoylglutathione lyase family enzyme